MKTIIEEKDKEIVELRDEVESLRQLARENEELRKK